MTDLIPGTLCTAIDDHGRRIEARYIGPLIQPFSTTPQDRHLVHDSARRAIPVRDVEPAPRVVAIIRRRD